MMLNGEMVVVDVKDAIRSCAVQHGADLNPNNADPNAISARFVLIEVISGTVEFSNYFELSKKHF